MIKGKKKMFVSPTQKQVDKFIDWIKKRNRFTISFGEKFGNISLRQTLDLANEKLDDGKVKIYSDYGSIAAGKFYKIEFIKNNP